MKKLNNMDLIVEMGNVNNKKRNYGIANTNKIKKRSVDSNKRNEIVEMSNNIVNTTKIKKRSTGTIKRNENKKFTLAVETNNNKSKKRNHDIVNANKSKKRSANNNKRNKNKKFTLEYYVEKCVEVAATKGFKIKGEKMWAIGMFEINEAKYLLTVDKYGLLFWFVDLATLVIAVTRYLSKSQDDNYDLNCHSISICDLWRLPLLCY